MNYRNMHTSSAMQKPETVVFDTRVNKVSNTETLNSSGNQENLVAYLKKKMFMYYKLEEKEINLELL